MVESVYVHHCGHEDCPRSTLSKHQSKPKGSKCASNHHIGSHEWNGKTEMFLRKDSVESNYIHKEVDIESIEECEQCGRLIHTAGHGGHWKSHDDLTWRCSDCPPPENQQDNYGQFA